MKLNYNKKSRTLTVKDDKEVSIFAYIFTQKEKHDEKDYPKKLYINISDFYLGSMDAFNDECYKYLEEIVVNDRCRNLKAVDGVLYSKNLARLFFCPKGKTGECIIPEGTQNIEGSSFEDALISKVVFPKTLRNIAVEAFSGSKIEEVEVNEGLMFIGKRAFYRCKNLKHFNFVSSLTAIENSAFACSGLEDVVIKGNPDISIYSEAFYQCPLKKVVMSEITNFCDSDIFTDADEVFVNEYNIHALRACTDTHVYFYQNHKQFLLLHIKDKPAIVLPRFIERKVNFMAYIGPDGIENDIQDNEYSAINQKILEFLDSGDMSKVYDLYKYGKSILVKASTAAEVVKRYNAPEAKEYLINNSKDIAKEFAKESEGELLNFAKSCKWSEDVLMSVREVAVDEGFVTAGAYVMEMMRGEKKKRFEV